MEGKLPITDVFRPMRTRSLTFSHNCETVTRSEFTSHTITITPTSEDNKSDTMEALRLEAEHLLNANYQLRSEVERLRSQRTRSSSHNNTAELYPSHVQKDEIDELRRDIRRLKTKVKVLMQRPVLTDPLTITEHFLPPELHLMVQKEVPRLDRPVFFNDILDFLDPQSISVADDVLVPPDLRLQYFPTFFSVNDVPVETLYTLERCHPDHTKQSIYELALQQIRASTIELDYQIYNFYIDKPGFNTKRKWDMLRRLPQLEHLDISLYSNESWHSDELPAPDALIQRWALGAAIKDMHKLKTVNVQLGGPPLVAPYGYVDERFRKYVQRMWTPKMMRRLIASVVNFHPRCQITVGLGFQA